ncbi:hypothetical protein [Streptomyces sp. NBC_01601]|uniref:hypothetical protein n=1 Tax=Streptomyces sp. NBC_01601 TaxID=2975892 RepID=UPI002E2AB2DC|nr:hypothetical protein [Streptomyces sp. NBC_01601]
MIAECGWPGEARVGREAASAAWLLAQHADQRPDVQRQRLELLSDAVTSGDADPQHGALLEDRVRVAQGSSRSSARNCSRAGTGRPSHTPSRTLRRSRH